MKQAVFCIASLTWVLVPASRKIDVTLTLQWYQTTVDVFSRALAAALIVLPFFILSQLVNPLGTLDKDTDFVNFLRSVNPDILRWRSLPTTAALEKMFKCPERIARNVVNWKLVDATRDGRKDTLVYLFE